MSWIKKLYDTYENCGSEIGESGGDGRITPLLPIAHSTQNAQLEVILNDKGDFLRARMIEKEDGMTIIPVTENSATRSSGIAPHPLCDKLQYVAGDYSKYVESSKGEEFYNQYIEALKSWCGSPHSNKKVCATLTYLQKKSLIEDLIAYKLLTCNEKNMLEKGVKIGVGDQSDAFVRFRVEKPGELESAVWLDKEVYQSYINYYLSLPKKLDLCYAMGKQVPCSEKHPAKVRNTADKAKLISANDEGGFTFKGRFSDKSQVVSVGYEASQKAHNALRWLIEKQGYKNGDQQVIVAWGTKNEEVPSLFQDTYDALFEEEAYTGNTEKEFAERLNKAVAGYSCNIETKSEIAIMGLEAATTGRLSITYYREINGLDFLNRVSDWHRTCSWMHTYKNVKDGFDEKGKMKFKPISFIGAPSPKDIFIVNYGEKASDKLKKSTIERLLPCIVDGAKLPYDLVNGAVNRVSNPVSMEKWEWQKALTVTCSLIKKYKYDKYGEVWKMALDENQMDRSYLFGRLLAIAQKIEERAIGLTGEKRDTNAERFMHQFKMHPYKTWGIITDKLKPYISRLGYKGTEYVALLTDVNSKISYEDFTSQKQLNESYILGYYCQRQVFEDQKNQRIEAKAKREIEKIIEGENENE